MTDDKKPHASEEPITIGHTESEELQHSSAFEEDAAQTAADFELSDDFWKLLAEGMPALTGASGHKNKDLEEVLTRPISEADFYYLLGKYPYLEICDPAAPVIITGRKAHISKSSAGWSIHDYGNVIRTSFCEALDNKRPPPLWSEQDETGEGGAGSFTGRGTIVQQMFNTAFDLINMARQRWGSVQIVAGFYSMQRAAWIAAMMSDSTLEGFDPTPEDYVVYNWALKFSGKKLRQVASPKFR